MVVMFLDSVYLSGEWNAEKFQEKRPQEDETKRLTMVMIDKIADAAVLVAVADNLRGDPAAAVEHKMV